MHIPIYERICEQGIDIFNSPSDIFEDFKTAKLFDRVSPQVNISSIRLGDTGAQREALWDLVLVTGIAQPVLTRYILEKSDGDGSYVFNEPLVMRQWITNWIQRIESQSQNVLDEVFESERLLLVNPKTCSTEFLKSDGLILNGLKAINGALMQRFVQGNTRIFSTKSTEGLQAQASGLQSLTEARATIESLSLQLSLTRWFDKLGLVAETSRMKDFYSWKKASARSKMKALKKWWNWSSKELVASSSLIIDQIVADANVDETIGSFPPPTPSCLYSMFPANVPLIVEQYKDAFVSQDLPALLQVGSDFQLQLALWLYIALDMVHLSIGNTTTTNGSSKDWIKKLEDTANSFSKALRLPTKMKNAIVAFWCVDFAVCAPSEEYKHEAIETALVILSNYSLAQDIELEKRFTIVQLVQLAGGENHTALRLVNALNLPSPLEWPKSFVALVVSIYLDGGSWQNAVSLCREVCQLKDDSVAFRKCLLNMYFLWCERHSKIPIMLELTFSSDEEEILEEFLLSPRNRNLGSAASLQCVDFYISFCLQRYRVEKALRLDIQQQAALRSCGAAVVLESPSFKARDQLLSIYKKTLLGGGSGGEEEFDSRVESNIFLKALEKPVNQYEDESDDDDASPPSFGTALHGKMLGNSSSLHSNMMEEEEPEKLPSSFPTFDLQTPPSQRMMGGSEANSPCLSSVAATRSSVVDHSLSPAHTVPSMISSSPSRSPFTEGVLGDALHLAPPPSPIASIPQTRAVRTLQSPPKQRYRSWKRQGDVTEETKATAEPVPPLSTLQQKQQAKQKKPVASMPSKMLSDKKNSVKSGNTVPKSLSAFEARRARLRTPPPTKRRPVTRSQTDETTPPLSIRRNPPRSARSSKKKTT